MKMIKSIVAASLIAASVASSSVLACGAIGCAVNLVAPGVGDALDDWHEQMGQPLDYVGAAAVTEVTGVPMGNICQTGIGWTNAAIQPVGTPCSITNGNYIYYGLIRQ